MCVCVCSWHAQRNTRRSGEQGIATCLSLAHYPLERGNLSFSSCQRAVAFIAMIYCTLVQRSLRHSVYDYSFLLGACMGRQSVEILTFFYSHCDVGICQRLFWPEAVCFQHIKTSTGGDSVSSYTVRAAVGLFVLHKDTQQRISCGGYFTSV